MSRSTRPIPITRLSVEQERLASRSIRIYTPSGLVVLRVEKMDFPYVTGTPEPGPGLVELDVGRLERAEAHDPSRKGPRRLSLPLAEADLLWPPTDAPHRVDFFMPAGVVRLDVVEVALPVVRGRPLKGSGHVRVDLRQASRIEVVETNAGMSLLATLGVVAGVLAAAFIIVVLTKESCPFVYVERGHGPELQGEAYPGAAFRSMQRDDLLALPDLPAGRHFVRFANEARETQFTDQASLLLVEHGTSQEALATPTAGFVLVGESVGPRLVRDLDGADRTGLVEAADGRFWQTDLVAAADSPRPPSWEGLEAEFEAPPRHAALEIVGGNTPWLDLVFGRFLASFGDRLGTFARRWNAPAAGRRLQAFREEQGIDLVVETRLAGTWRRVAVVPTVGPIAQRRLAVPLPPQASRVRIRSGVGFWRVDALRLRARTSEPARSLTLRPVRARGTGSDDALDRLAAVDGAYHVLAQIGDRVDLDFDVPPATPGLARTAFLHCNGYYDVHTPIQGSWSASAARAARQPGGMTRLSLELARAYVAEARRTPGSPGGGP